RVVPEVRLDGVRAPEVRLEEDRLPEVRPGEVRPAEVRPTEVRVAEVRADVGVLATPCVPGGHVPLEQCHVLGVRHRSISVPIRIFSGMRVVCKAGGRATTITGGGRSLLPGATTAGGRR